MESTSSFPVTVKVTCDKCGSKDVAIPETEGSLDPIACNSCGADLGTRAALDEKVKVEIEKKITDHFDSILERTFKDSPNIRVTKGRR